MKIFTLFSVLALIPAVTLASHLDGPVYFDNMKSNLPLDCQVEINRLVASNCPDREGAFTVVSDRSINPDRSFGECEARFEGDGFVIVGWDQDPGFPKYFSLVGLYCGN